MRAGRHGAQATVRRGRKFRSWLAILSLLVQLAATAGHFHPEDFASVADKGGAAALAASGGEGRAGSPQGGQPGAPAHDDCSLCFSLQLVGAAALPGPVALPVPSGRGAETLTYLREIRRSAAPHLLFQTRAPPIA